MSDVFISYAREREADACTVKAALAAGGFDVWSDAELPAHRSYAEVIQERLEKAKAVVVLWSAEAAASQWVRAEADYARNKGILVQATLDGAEPPLPFNQIQCADLDGWSGDDSSGWRKVLASVDALVGARKVRAQSPRSAGISICVLPFQNMSGDAEQEYFSDGISEDITTDLSKVSALTVTARNTAFQFKGQRIDVGEVARRLGVSHVLEGSVRKAGGRVRITAQLIDGATGAHLWADRYDRDLTDIFAIQDEISKAIVAALKVKLLPSEKQAMARRGTANVEAYNLYLMARQFWVNGNYGDIRRDQIVARTAQMAIDLDPQYAQAWALLAIAQNSLRHHHGMEGEDGVAAARQALSLDPSIAEAYAVLTRNLAECGDYEGAEAMAAKGLALDPDSWDVNREAGRTAHNQRKSREAYAYYRRATELDTRDFHSALMMQTSAKALGDDAGLREASRMLLERAERAIAEDPLNAAALGSSAGALLNLGELEKAKERQRRAILIDPDNLNLRYNFACTLVTALGEHNEAAEIIAPLLDRTSPALLLSTLIDPDMDTLRDHPRFIESVQRNIRRTGLDVSILPDTIRRWLDETRPG